MTLSKNNRYLTFINTFKVDPSNQQKLVDILTKGTNESVCFQEGFVASALHRSLDGKKVTMYAQWKSLELYNKMRDNQQAAEIFKEATTIAEFDGGMYEVVEDFERHN